MVKGESQGREGAGVSRIKGHRVPGLHLVLIVWAELILVLVLVLVLVCDLEDWAAFVDDCRAQQNCAIEKLGSLDAATERG